MSSNIRLMLLAIFLALSALVAGVWRLTMIQVPDLLTQIEAIRAQIAAIPATAPPVDLQPVADGLTAVSSDLTAKFPPA